LKTVMAGLAALLAAVPVAMIIARVNDASVANPLRAVTIITLVCAVVVVLPPFALWVSRRRAVAPATLGLATLLGVAVALTAIALHALWGTISFPADFLVWSEGDFVNDLIKLRVGYPLYSAQANNDS